MRTPTFNRVALFVAATLCCSMIAAPAQADTGTGAGSHRESFEQDMGGWEPDTDGLARKWEIERTKNRAFDGLYSLRYYLDGTFDDGTIWVERKFAVRPHEAITAVVTFALYTEHGGITAWPVVGVASVHDPEVEQDLPRIGLAEKAGWVRHGFKTEIKADASGTVYVGVGISATFEVVRTHHIDLVDVTFVPR